MITGSTKQIITAYEVAGLNPSQIVEAFDGEYDETAIKAVLAQFSSKYRRDFRVGNEEVKRKLGFTEEQEIDACEVIASQIHSEDEHIAQRAAIFIREDRQGRRDPISKMANLGLNLIQFNQLILAANKQLGLDNVDRKAIADRKDKPASTGKFIDIEATPALDSNGTT